MVATSAVIGIRQSLCYQARMWWCGGFLGCRSGQVLFLAVDVHSGYLMASNKTEYMMRHDEQWSHAAEKGEPVHRWKECRGKVSLEPSRFFNFFGPHLACFLLTQQSTRDYDERGKLQTMTSVGWNFLFNRAFHSHGCVFQKACILDASHEWQWIK